MPLLPKFPEKKDAEALPPPEHSRKDIYQVIGRLDLLKRAVELVSGTLPAFTHSIRVTVVGGPRSDIRRIWYLAVSTALGRRRNGLLDGLTPLSVSTDWDITGKAVSIELVYQANKLRSGFTGELNLPCDSPVGFLIRGPEQLTVGASWDTLLGLTPLTKAGVLLNGNKHQSHARPIWTARLVNSAICLRDRVTSPVSVYAIVDRFPASATISPNPSAAPVNVLRELPTGGSGSANLRGQPGSFTAKTYPYRVVENWIGPTAAEPPFTTLPDGFTVPDLPDDGRVITTVEKNDPRVQPPKPSVDGHTRFSILALVAQSLQVPCFLVSSPPCTENDYGHAGLFLHDPGNAWNTDPVAFLKQLVNTTAPGAWPLRATAGPDGYPIQPDRANLTSTNPLSPF